LKSKLKLKSNSKFPAFAFREAGNQEFNFDFDFKSGIRAEGGDDTRLAGSPRLLQGVSQGAAGAPSGRSIPKGGQLRG